MKRSLAIIVMFLFFVGAAQAQDKYGYVNFGNILQLMPELQGANAELKAFQDSLVNAYNNQKQAFEANYAKLQRDVSQGLLSRTKQEQAEAELRAEQQKLLNQEGVISSLIQQKRAQLMTPIVKRVQNAINEVGAEGDFKMIFDVSLGAILHAAEAQDLDDKVKVKLNIGQ